MRILDITNFYAPRSGGIRTYLEAKIDYCAARDVRHVLVVPGPVDRAEERGHSRILQVKGPEIPFARPYRLLTSTPAIRRIIATEQPDLIEVGSPFLVPHLTRIALDGRPVPTVGFYHSDLLRTYAEPYVTSRAAAPLRVLTRMASRRLVRSVYSRFELTVAASPSVARELRAWGVDRVACVPLGVDLDRFRPRPEAPAVLRRRLGIAPGKAIGIFAGRFVAEKRLDVVMDAHRMLPESERPHLLLVGDGAWRDRLRSDAVGRPDVSVLPYLTDREELARLYAGSDIYLAAGPGETFGLAIAEGIAAGLAVLCVDKGGGPDRVRGSGVEELYVHGNARSCARAMARLVARLGRATRARARAHAERTLSWERTFDELFQLYAALAGVPAARRRVA